MGKLERDFWNNKVKKDLEKLDNCVFFRIENRVSRGTPDVFVCLNGKFVALELKRSEKEANKKRDGYALQKYWAQKINKNKGIAFITYPENWDAVYSNLKAT